MIDLKTTFVEDSALTFPFCTYGWEWQRLIHCPDLTKSIRNSTVHISTFFNAYVVLLRNHFFRVKFLILGDSSYCSHIFVSYLCDSGIICYYLCYYCTLKDMCCTIIWYKYHSQTCQRKTIIYAQFLFDQTTIWCMNTPKNVHLSGLNMRIL